MPKFRAWLSRVVRLCIAATIGCIVSAWFSLSPIAAHDAYDHMLFPKCPLTQDMSKVKLLSGLQPRDVWFKEPKSNARLHGWWFENPNAQYTVVIHHGQGVNMSACGFFADYFILRGASVLAYDYKGHGDSEGTPTTTGLYDDAIAAAQFIAKEKHVAAGKLVQVGVSLGTAPACAAANAVAQTAGTILFSPYTSLKEEGRSRLVWLRTYPDWMINYDDIGCMAPLSKPHPPTLIFHGTKDTVIPVEFSEQLAKKAIPPLQVVIDQSLHTCSLSHNLVATDSEICGFLQRNMGISTLPLNTVLSEKKISLPS